MYDRQKADIILDVPTSSAALAVANQAKARKEHINISAGTTALTGKSCNKYTFHWAYDTYMLAQGTGTTVKNGGKDWSSSTPTTRSGRT